MYLSFMKEGIKIARSLIRLYLIHISAIPAIALSMYFPGLDLFLSILYLGLIWQEGMGNKTSGYNQVWIGFLWQLPGILLSLINCMSLNLPGNISYYSIFILEIWQTPVLPLISLAPAFLINYMPFYYYLLFAMIPILIGWYWAPVLKKKPVIIKSEKSNPLA